MPHSPAPAQPAGLPGPPGRPAAIARGLCPRCRQGRVFRSLMSMNETCPSCGHRFEREPGFFLGAMYVSYGLAVVIYLMLLGLAALALRGRPQLVVFGAALLMLLPCVPFLFRYSRLIWLHLDWALDPGA